MQKLSILNRLKDLKDKTKGQDSLEYNPPVLTNNNKILLYVCGGFSIIFSMTTLIQLYSPTLSIYIFIGLAIFLLTILIFNEKYKVESLTSLGGQFTTTSLIIGCITLTVSLSSVYGLYTGIDTIVDLNEAKGVKEVNDNPKIDSLNNLMLYKLDSLAYSSNPLIQEKIDDYNRRLAKTTRYEVEEKEKWSSKIDEEKIKLEEYKQTIKSHLQTQINKEEKIDNLSSNINTKTKNNSSIIMIALTIFSLITEIVIVGVSISAGKSHKIYEEELEKYDEEYNRKVKEEQKKIESSPHIKKLLDYVGLLTLLYDLDSKEISKKTIEEVSILRGRRYSSSEIDEFRGLLIKLNILEVTHNKTRLVMDLQESIDVLDNLFSKVQ